MRRELREKCQKSESLKLEIRGIAENPKASSAELKRAEGLMEELRKLQGEIDAGERADGADLSARQGRPIGGGAAAPAWGGEVRVFQRGQKISEAYPNTERLSLGRYLRGAITGNWRGAEAEREEFRALSTGTGQVLIPKQLSAEVLDLARNKSVLLSAGVPIVEMESDNLSVAKIAADPAFSFKKELEPIEETDFVFDKAQLQAHTAYGLLRVSLEVLHSAQNLEQVLKQAMAAAMARVIDERCLLGTGVDEPAGILLDADINRVQAGEVKGYKPFVQAVGKIRQSNGEPTHWAINAFVDEWLNLAVDGEGRPVEIPKVIEGMTRVVSNQLPSNGGAGENESLAAVFDPNAICIGQQVPLSVKVSDTAGDALKTGSVMLAVYSMLDVCLLNPKHVCVIQGLTEPVPPQAG